jgi:hypothetical protein
MEDRSEESTSLINLVLPKGLLEYFVINKIEHLENSIGVYLEEKNIIPEEYANDKLTSKGFYEAIQVQDFPIRGKAVYLYVKRRRWINETRGNIVMRDWELVAKGTRMTKEFASFLKVISGYQAGKL